MAIPTRTAIQNQIDTIRHDAAFSTLQEEIYTKIGLWLDGEGVTADDKQKILDDLVTYEGI